MSSAAGPHILVKLASNTGESTSSKTFGLVHQSSLNQNTQGTVVTEGLLQGFNTSAAGNEGDPIWLGPTGNLIFGLTNKPQAPNHLVYLGVVTRKHATQGEIFVHIQNGFEVRELHDARIINEQNSDILIYNSSSGLWLNSGVNFGNFYTNNNPSGFITGVDLSSYVTNSQTGQFYPASNPSGYIGSAVLSNYITATGNHTIGGRLTFTDPPLETKATPSISTGTLTLNLAEASLFYVSLNAAITTMTLQSVPASPAAVSFTLQFVADGTAKAVTWPAGTRWAGGTAPTLTSILNKVDTFTFLTHDGGTNWFAFVSNQNQ